MDTTRVETSVETHAEAFDTLARSLHRRLPRRRVTGLLAAALATGVLGIGSQAEPAAAKRKRGKRNVRRSSDSGSGSDTETVAAKSIPPNCIYVCCDGTCDSWKMCLKCVKWPKGSATTATATLAAG